MGTSNVRNWKTIKSCSFRRKDPKNYHYIYILTKIWKKEEEKKDGEEEKKDEEIKEEEKKDGKKDNKKNKN